MAVTDLPNPKDAYGKLKPGFTTIPATTLLHLGRAHQDGADKYGPLNWREHPVLASVYVDAIWRHLLAWWEGEENAADSGVPHLAHVMACASILIDASHMGNMLDDRPAIRADFSALVAAHTKLKMAEPMAAVAAAVAQPETVVAHDPVAAMTMSGGEVAQ